MSKGTNVLHAAVEKFFSGAGNAVMKLTRDAAADVCTLAIDHGLVVERIEGGIWHNPGFEARLDCIWDGMDPPLDRDAAIQNNLKAERFIHSAGECDSFVLTVAPLSGWPHKS